MIDEIPTISCVFNTENALYQAYMPFIKDGGLFIRTKSEYELGCDVILTIFLLDDPDEYTIEGKVAWITPIGAQGNKPAGIGVQFTGKEKRNLCNKIETLLAGKLKLTQPTDTM